MQAAAGRRGILYVAVEHARDVHAFTIMFAQDADPLGDARVLLTLIQGQAACEDLALEAP
jgi:hypothetical protein